MEKELKMALGKILGEVYRVQNHQGICNVSDYRIFGLLNGIEEAVDAELAVLDLIPAWKVKAIKEYLNPYTEGNKDLKELEYPNAARHDVEKQGISEVDFNTILKYLRAANLHVEAIDRIGDYSLSDRDI